MPQGFKVALFAVFVLIAIGAVLIYSIGRL